ncbi:caveolin-1-like [Styela clava]
MDSGNLSGSRKSLERKSEIEMMPVDSQRSGGADPNFSQRSGPQSMNESQRSEGDPVSMHIDDAGMESIEMDDGVNVDQPTSKQPSEKADSIDYDNRDPNNIHEDVKVNFADIIAEPSGAHSFETVWGTSYKVYSLTKYWIYQVMSLIFGIPISLFWGIYFSCLAFCSVWCITPCIRSFIIKIGFVGKLWGACVGTVLDPCFESIGLVLSRVRVAMTVRKE